MLHRYYRNTMPTITFKVTPKEAARIKRLAARAGCTVSEFLRRRATEAPETRNVTGEYRVEISPKTGLPVMSAPRDLPSVSSEEIKALLTDFP